MARPKTRHIISPDKLIDVVVPPAIQEVDMDGEVLEFEGNGVLTFDNEIDFDEIDRKSAEKKKQLEEKKLAEKEKYNKERSASRKRTKAIKKSSGKVIETLTKGDIARDRLVNEYGVSAENEGGSLHYSPGWKQMLHCVMNKENKKFYKEGFKFGPCKILGVAAFGNVTTKSAFKLLQNLQSYIAEQNRKFTFEKDNYEDPEWLLITSDKSVIYDIYIYRRLSDLSKEAHVAAPFGYEGISTNGKFWLPQNAMLGTSRGCYAQNTEDNLEWNYVVGDSIDTSHKYRVLIGFGPYLAVRTETFMKMDFSHYEKHCIDGRWHYQAEISLQAHLMGHKIAQIKTQCCQFDSLNNYKDTDDFKHDHDLFMSKWNPYLPMSINKK